MTNAELYDYLYENDSSFKEYVENQNVLENFGNITKLHDSVGTTTQTLKEKVLTFFSKVSDSQNSFFSSVFDKSKYVLAIIAIIAFFLLKSHIFQFIKEIKK
jgi:hypothetical protein